jgi:hypothetical protein
MKWQASLLPLLAFSQTALALWPIPKSYSLGNSTLWIGQHVQVTVQGAGSSNVGTMSMLYSQQPEEDLLKLFQP